MGTVLLNVSLFRLPGNSYLTCLSNILDNKMPEYSEYSIHNCSDSIPWVIPIFQTSITLIMPIKIC